MRRFWITAAIGSVALCGCAAPVVQPQHPFPEQTVCGTLDGFWSDPVRVLDSDCMSEKPGVRWWSADPAELDYDDYTPVGGTLNDDYTGAADSHRTHRRSATPTTQVAVPTFTARPVAPAPKLSPPTSKRVTPTRVRPTNR